MRHSPEKLTLIGENKISFLSTAIKSFDQLSQIHLYTGQNWNKKSNFSAYKNGFKYESWESDAKSGMKKG